MIRLAEGMGFGQNPLFPLGEWCDPCGAESRQLHKTKRLPADTGSLFFLMGGAPSKRTCHGLIAVYGSRGLPCDPSLPPPCAALRSASRGLPLTVPRP